MSQTAVGAPSKPFGARYQTWLRWRLSPGVRCVLDVLWVHLELQMLSEEVSSETGVRLRPDTLVLAGSSRATSHVMRLTLAHYVCCTATALTCCGVNTILDCYSSGS